MLLFGGCGGCCCRSYNVACVKHVAFEMHHKEDQDNNDAVLLLLKKLCFTLFLTRIQTTKTSVFFLKFSVCSCYGFTVFFFSKKPFNLRLNNGHWSIHSI